MDNPSYCSSFNDSVNVDNLASSTSDQMEKTEQQQQQQQQLQPLFSRPTCTEASKAL
jgi:hypothetical protein